MRYVAMGDFRKNTAQIRKNLQNGEWIVLTSRGKPCVLMNPVDPDRLAEDVALYRLQRALMDGEQLTDKPKADGIRLWTKEETDAETARARAEIRAEAEKADTRLRVTAKNAK